MSFIPIPDLMFSIDRHFSTNWTTSLVSRAFESSHQSILRRRQFWRRLRTTHRRDGVSEQLASCSATMAFLFQGQLGISYCIHKSLNHITYVRDFIRNVLATHAPEGLARRFPGANRIRRSTLSSIGPNHQHHADGHEKLNAQGLNMGGVGLSIYGIKDQWSSFILHLVVVPNNRLATTIGHVYLDCVEKYMCKYSSLIYVQYWCIFNSNPHNLCHG